MRSLPRRARAPRLAGRRSVACRSVRIHLRARFWGGCRAPDGRLFPFAANTPLVVPPVSASTGRLPWVGLRTISTRHSCGSSIRCPFALQRVGCGVHCRHRAHSSPARNSGLRQSIGACTKMLQHWLRRRRPGGARETNRLPDVRVRRELRRHDGTKHPASNAFTKTSTR